MSISISCSMATYQSYLSINTGKKVISISISNSMTNLPIVLVF